MHSRRNQSTGSHSVLEDKNVVSVLALIVNRYAKRHNDGYSVSVLLIVKLLRTVGSFRFTSEP